MADDSIGLLPMFSRGDDLPTATDDADLVVLAVPDEAISTVAQLVKPRDGSVVAHLSGATSLDALAPHARRASLHPLVSMTEPDDGAEALRGAWMTVSGDPMIEQVATALQGRVLRVAEIDRVRYHAAAAIASNHVVALLGQVERLSKSVGVPVEAFLALTQTALENTRRLGPAGALTGPVSRGDWRVVRSHLRAIPETERAAYFLLAQQAALLAGVVWPPDISL